MLKIRSIQDGARVLWCVRDLLAAIENTTSVTKYTEKVAASDKLKIALGEGGKNKQETLFIATDAAINLLMRSRSEKAAAVIAFIKSDGEPAKPATTKQDNPISDLFNEFAKRELRSVLWKGEAWFCAYDICRILEYARGRDAVATLCSDEGKVNAAVFSGGETSPLNIPANLERVTARFQLSPCVKRTETLIVSAKPLPAIGSGTQLTLESAKENRQYLAAQA